MLHFLYETIPGRVILKLLINKNLSQLCGRFLDSRASKALIPYFVNKNNIDLSVCEKKSWREFDSFNDCFCRKLQAGQRTADPDPDVLISPCDGLLSVYPINDDLVMPVKQSMYSVNDLLLNPPLAKEYDGGYCFVFRLCVNHYHRYCFPDNGKILFTQKLPGVLHTVRPIALRAIPVFTENAREYTVLDTDRFGTIVQMEVGAMLVGKISNHKLNAPFFKGQEKGHFLYGGSTVILLVQKDKVNVPEDFLINTANDVETPISLGEKIAVLSSRQ